jgi:hypothetical protein
MSAPRGQTKATPQTIYNELTLLCSKKETTYEESFFSLLHPNKNLENSRNDLLRLTLENIKTELTSNGLAIESGSQLEIKNNPTAHDVIQRHLVHLIDYNITNTIDKIDKTLSLEAEKDKMKLGKVHEHCIRLCPDAFIEFLWKRFFIAESEKTQSRNYQLSDEQLMKLLDDSTKQKIQSDPLFLTRTPVDLLKTINDADAIILGTIKTRPRKNSSSITPTPEETSQLLMARELMNTWINEGTWNDELYGKIHKQNSSAVYRCPDTKSILFTVIKIQEFREKYAPKESKNLRHN